MEECFASSDEGVTTLERYNRAAQEKRVKEKSKLVSAKAAAAERVSAKAVEKAKLAAEKAAKKVALAKNKSKKQGAKKKSPNSPHNKKTYSRQQGRLLIRRGHRCVRFLASRQCVV